LDHQNNFAGILKIISNAATKNDVLAIILIVQQNYFSDLYPVKILDLSAKPFFSWRHLCDILGYSVLDKNLYRIQMCTCSNVYNKTYVIITYLRIVGT